MRAPISVAVLIAAFLYQTVAFGTPVEVSRAEDVGMSSEGKFPTSNGEYYWGGLAATLFWIDPQEEMVAILLTQYLPYRGDAYRDLFHRLVRAAIIE